MNIGIDARLLTERYRTGVGEYTVELLNTVFKLDQTNTYYLFANAWRTTASNLPSWTFPNVHFVLTHFPNKLLNASLASVRLPHLDTLINKHLPAGQTLDVFFSPNLNFTSLSKNVRHFVTVHDLAFQLFPQFFTTRQRVWHQLLAPKRQLQRATGIFVPSLNTKRDLVENNFAPEQKITVLTPGVPNGVAAFAAQNFNEQQKEIQRVKKCYQLPENYILFLGTIEPRKNLNALISAFTVANGKIPNSHQLIIAGAPGWKNNAVYQAAEHSPAKRQIHFLGYVDPADKPALYAGAKLFVYPSFYEGFGFPVLETMALGVPVITSNRSSLPEVTGSAAYLVNPHRPEEIAQGMVALLTNEHTRAAHIKNGLSRAREFNWEATAKTWLATISA